MSAHISRREFQRDLAQRLQSAARGETARSMLGFLSNQQFWLCELADAGAIVPLPPLLDVPLTRPWFAGIANLRGTLYSVVDFSAYCGGEPTDRNSDARLLLIGAPLGSNSALLVGRTLGLRSLANLEEDGGAAPPAQAWVGKSYRDEKGNAWCSLKIRQLLAHPDFLDIGL